jgi:NAD-dependent dihydropyrimidine dehydrogenase PreA subunit
MRGGTVMNKTWTIEEDTWLINNYKNKSKDEIIEKLKNRTWDSIKTRHNRLNNFSYRKSLNDYKTIDDVIYKRCSKCEKYHPMNSNYFGKNSRRKDGFMTECRECQGKEFLKEHKEGCKICKICNRELPMTTVYFRRDITYSNGFINICKECQGYHFTEDFVGRKEYNSRIIEDVISITNPKECIYFVNSEDTDEYTIKSTKMVEMKCPYCGLFLS